MRRLSLCTYMGLVVVFFVVLCSRYPRVGKIESLPRPKWGSLEAWRAGNASGPANLARAISAADLLARRPAAGSARVPKIFHQSWKDTELPAKFQRWSESCRQKHKDWEWVIWTDQDNLTLVRTYFPWLEALYLAMPGEIYRADLVRAMYMYMYGGVYADLDTECLRPTEELQKRYNVLFDGPNARPSMDTAMFGRMGDDPSFEHSIPNAWMASTPGHPFFLVYLQTFVERAKPMADKKRTSAWAAAEHVTGPVVLRQAIAEYEAAKVRAGNSLSGEVVSMAHDLPFATTQMKDHQVVLLPSQYIYPFNWNADNKKVRVVCWVQDGRYNPDECKKALDVGRKKSISITYWSHTHKKSGLDEDKMKRIKDSG
ncbi:hypothetical protein CDD83_5215 [Cordyceps sp. RAO-2017]|nr:hypothetical protein CDD83_5215 [Cordyceps sp. RAO-2017]